MGAEVGYFHHVAKGVDWVFVDHPSYPRPGGLYADEHGVYGDNQVRDGCCYCTVIPATLSIAPFVCSNSNTVGTLHRLQLFTAFWLVGTVKQLCAPSVIMSLIVWSLTYVSYLLGLLLCAVPVHAAGPGCP